MPLLAISISAVIAFALGWWLGQRVLRKKIGVIRDKVEAGKRKVQKAVDANK